VDHVETPINGVHWLSAIPLLHGPANGNDMLCAALILAIMITPFITSVSRDILTAIPRIAREGSYAVGATKWETIQGVVLPFARGGIIGAVILGLGRALGETMAVTMVIGNSRAFSFSLFSAGNTMSSLIANEFSEASFDLYRSALIEIGLCLFVVTMIVNGVAKILVRYTARDIQTGGRH
jgi:phosphate transport system permease protein